LADAIANDLIDAMLKRINTTAEIFDFSSHNWILERIL